MKNFNYERAESFQEAAAKKGEPGTAIKAGGTDLIGIWKDSILSENPDTVIDLAGIDGAGRISVINGELKLGAMARLSDISASEAVKKTALGIVEAAHSVATPQIRNSATVGGNLCQDVRCWFYRYPQDAGGRLDCMRKGGDQCYAVQGDNRYHSVFGGMKVTESGCSMECPAGTDIPAYMDRIRKNDWDGAAGIMMQYNPMPMVTSRICPHPCQNVCNQCKHGDSVNIHGMERSIGDYILAHMDDYFKAPEKETGKKAAVVGAGPGGLTAAYYLRKAGNEVVVFDRMEKAGGVLTYGIPHYRLPKKYVEAYAAALQKMGVQFRMGVNIGETVSLEELDKQFDALYFGTGAWKQPILGLEGENLTEFGLNFLVDVNTYLEKAIGNEVLVCGGGNVAMDVALTAVRLGAKKVRLICLEQRDEMPASAEEIARAEEEGVEIHNGWGLSKVITDSNGKVTGLESMQCVSVFNEQHRFSPKYDHDKMQKFESDYIILATGQAVDVSFLGEKFSGQLKTQRGLIDADAESARTKDPKIYAGGDAVTGPNIAIRAIRSGRNAALNINMGFELKPAEKLTQDRFRHYDTNGIVHSEANRMAERPVCARTLTDEDVFSFSAEAAASEAARCMNCACYSVNPSDMMPMLIAMDAVITTTERTVSAEELFTGKLKICDVLGPNEVVTEITIPCKKSCISHYDKFRLRNAVDFSMVSLGSAFEMEGKSIRKAGLVFGGVAPIPLRAKKAEDYLAGRTVTEEVAEKAAKIAVEDAQPLSGNAYKVNEMQVMLKDAILRAGAEA